MTQPAPAEPSIRGRVVLALAASPDDRVSRAYLRSLLPVGRSVAAAPGTRRFEKGSKARGDSVSDRYRIVLQDMEKAGLLRREHDAVVILDRAALVAAARRLQLAAGLAGPLTPGRQLALIRQAVAA